MRRPLVISAGSQRYVAPLPETPCRKTTGVDRRGHRKRLRQRAQAPLDGGRQVMRRRTHVIDGSGFEPREPQGPGDVSNVGEVEPSLELAVEPLTLARIDPHLMERGEFLEMVAPGCRDNQRPGGVQHPRELVGR
jgi:hypothetical protein